MIVRRKSDNLKGGAAPANAETSGGAILSTLSEHTAKRAAASSVVQAAQRTFKFWNHASSVSARMGSEFKTARLPVL